MMTDAQAFAEAARKMLGSPFRLYGRDPKTGVDCLGLVLHALIQTGRKPGAMPSYRLRNSQIDAFIPLIPKLGLVASAQSAVKEGDLLLTCPSAAQFHLGIACGATAIIHAHAGLRRVVRSPLPPSKTIYRRWQLA